MGKTRIQSFFSFFLLYFDNPCSFLSFVFFLSCVFSYHGLRSCAFVSRPFLSQSVAVGVYAQESSRLCARVRRSLLKASGVCAQALASRGAILAGAAGCLQPRVAATAVSRGAVLAGAVPWRLCPGAVFRPPCRGPVR